MATKKPTMWRDKPIDTIGQLLDACCSCETREDAESLLKAYRTICPDHAASNIGYILGYLGSEDRERLYALFSECNHPVFGGGFGRGKDVSPEEALEMGRRRGEELRAQSK